MGADFEDVLRWAKRQDWVRIVHVGATFVRALRDDPAVATDAQREHARADQMKRLFNSIARAAVGCARLRDPDAGCACQICMEPKR